MTLYCARLHVVCIVDDPVALIDREHTCDYQFVMIVADDTEHAFRRACDVGRDQETDYVNGDGQRVQWRLRAVEHLRELPTDLHGVEVGYLLDVYHPDEQLFYDPPFEPKLFAPTTDLADGVERHSDG